MSANLEGAIIAALAALVTLFGAMALYFRKRAGTANGHDRRRESDRRLERVEQKQNALEVRMGRMEAQQAQEAIQLRAVEHRMQAITELLAEFKGSVEESLDWVKDTLKEIKESRS